MTEVETIKKVLKKYSVLEAYLFGSYADAPHRARDIDIGVRLRNKGEFFVLSSDLAEKLDKEVDLVWLGGTDAFSSLVKRDGIKIHG